MVCNIWKTMMMKLFQLKEVINNLKVAKLEMKVEADGDVLDYVHNKEIIPVKISSTQSMSQIEVFISNLQFKILSFYRDNRILPPMLFKVIQNPSRIHRGVSF